MDQNKEQYFEYFSGIIKNIKKCNSIDNKKIEAVFTGISNLDGLNLQDIITYMLYCFEVIELTQKWKLKKAINYNYFINNMHNIYNEIFCISKSTFNNKIIAANSFGNIIVKTINYGIDSPLNSILVTYLKCITEKRKCLKDKEIVLLRGNLYCQIYMAVKNNADLSKTCEKYLKILTDIFNYQKYLDGVEQLFQDMLKHEQLSINEINIFVAYKAYNNMAITELELKKIFTLLLTNYPYEFFDKELFIYLIKMFTKHLIIEKKLNVKLEIVFENAENTKDNIFLNYNMIDYNFFNNLQILKDICYKLNILKFEDDKLLDDFTKLLKIKDELISKKNIENNTILNYKNMIRYLSIIEVNKFFGVKSQESFYKYFEILINEKLNNSVKNDSFNEKKLTNIEIFQNIYSNNEIKELLKSYPILSFEYNEDGFYKSLPKLIEEKLILVKKISDKQKRNETIEKALKTYDMLINYRNCDLYSLLNDYYTLFLIDTIDSNLIKEKEIILTQVLPTLLKYKLMYCGKIPNSELEEIYREYINPCIKKISQNRVNNKKFTNTKDFLNYEKSNTDNYFALCKLQEIFGKIDS